MRMGDSPEYPELSRKRLTSGWWKANRNYTIYMFREWTSLFVAGYSLLFIYGLSLWMNGSSVDFLNFLKNPAVIGFSLVALIFTMYHAVTWFYLLGAVAPVKIGRSRTKPWQALVLNLVLLVIVSYVAIWLVVLR
jgi:fumarate reductase subunit C